MNLRAAPGTVLVVLALAACAGRGVGDESEGGPGDPEDGGSAACRLLTTEEVSGLFGQPAQAVPADGDTPAVRGSESCLWEATVDGANPTVHQLQLSVFAGDEAFDPSAWGGDPEAVPDLGDEAFLVPSGLLGTTAGYRDGERTVILSHAVPLGDDPPGTATQPDQVLELLRAVHDRLG